MYTEDVPEVAVRLVFWANAAGPIHEPSTPTQAILHAARGKFSQVSLTCPYPSEFPHWHRRHVGHMYPVTVFECKISCTIILY